jgi:hypothetical protein
MNEAKKVSASKLKVKPSLLPGAGSGLFTQVDIPSGATIIEYKGRVYPRDEYHAIKAREGVDFGEYAIESPDYIPFPFVIDGQDEALSNIARFANGVRADETYFNWLVWSAFEQRYHAPLEKKSNPKTEKSRCAKADLFDCRWLMPNMKTALLGTDKIVFEAIRNIKAGEELVYSYGSNYWNETKQQAQQSIQTAVLDFAMQRLNSRFSVYEVLMALATKIKFTSSLSNDQIWSQVLQVLHSTAPYKDQEVHVFSAQQQRETDHQRDQRVLWANLILSDQFILSSPMKQDIITYSFSKTGEQKRKSYEKKRKENVANLRKELQRKQEEMVRNREKFNQQEVRRKIPKKGEPATKPAPVAMPAALLNPIPNPDQPKKRNRIRLVAN